MNFLSVDHIAVAGYTNFNSNQSNARILISNSIFEGSTPVYAGGGHATISNFQVLSFYDTSYSPGTLACFAVYNAYLQLYPGGCASSAP